MGLVAASALNLAIAPLGAAQGLAPASSLTASPLPGADDRLVSDARE
ncbi:MAG: hypothetical protein I8H76_11915, partial [Burkholderiales bacterium]|nr:hypothetical protein [Burkholderiales bacterium]